MKETRVFYYVQHLQGVGHLKRAAAIARVIAERGGAVTFVSGGLPIEGIDTGGCSFFQLPPIQVANSNFDVFLDKEGKTIDSAFRQHRKKMLLRIFRETRPSVLITEMFPFGRLLMRFELIPLMEAALSAAPRPAILCSVRDILVQPPNESNYTTMLDLARHFFDKILVHGDPDLIDFEETFPPASMISQKIFYTGYVVDGQVVKKPAPSPRARGDVVVSAGSAATGLPLFEAALKARPLTSLADRRWRIMLGPHFPEEDRRRLEALVDGDVVLERFRPDFVSVLEGCALSISRGGYNTMLEVMRAGVPAVIVPHHDSLQNEQMFRARVFGDRGAFVPLPEAALSPESLAAAAGKALTLPPFSFGRIKLNGAEETARIVTGA